MSADVLISGYGRPDMQRRPAPPVIGVGRRATPATGVLDSKVLLLVGEYGARLDNRAPVFSLI